MPSNGFGFKPFYPLGFGLGCIASVMSEGLMMLGAKIRLEKVKGIGDVELYFRPDQRVYTLIGSNGIGKTKTLESLFQLLFFTHQAMKKLSQTFQPNVWHFSKVKFNQAMDAFEAPKIPIFVKNIAGLHELPVLFLGAHSRGHISSSKYSVKTELLGSFEQRQIQYFSAVIDRMSEDFSSLNMDVGLDQWFVKLAQSSNPYQKKEDNREVELKAVLEILHKIDSRIDANFLEIPGDNRVSLKIEGQKRQLSQLSSGFASLLKIVQSIVSGYGYFTNETQLQNVKGIVLIDEIESHLHLGWQAEIIPLLKELFPNTTFYITTHSPIVLSQLTEGEAYQLERDDDGVVRSSLIGSPNKSAMVDVLKEAFGVDLNRMKLDQALPEKQQKAKQALLGLLKQTES